MQNSYTALDAHSTDPDLITNYVMIQDKYSYIEHPKKTGYRSIHDVYPGSDIVLVRADTSAEVKTAFRNYFKDARDFVKLMDTGCAKLGTHHHVEASPTIHDGSKTVKNAPLEHRA